MDDYFVPAEIRAQKTKGMMEKHQWLLLSL